LKRTSCWWKPWRAHREHAEDSRSRPSGHFHPQCIWGEFWPGLLEELEAELGPADGVSEEFAFDRTGYYDEELGTSITRRIIEFKSLEGRYELKGKRLFNLDPGFVTMQSLVLVTGKNFSHRIYLKDGIWPIWL